MNNLEEKLQVGIAYFERTGSIPATDWMITMSKKHNIDFFEIKRFFRSLYLKAGV